MYRKYLAQLLAFMCAPCVSPPPCTRRLRGCVSGSLEASEPCSQEAVAGSEWGGRGQGVGALKVLQAQRTNPLSNSRPRSPGFPPRNEHMVGYQIPELISRAPQKVTKPPPAFGNISTSRPLLDCAAPPIHVAGGETEAQRQAVTLLRPCSPVRVHATRVPGHYAAHTKAQRKNHSCGVNSGHVGLGPALGPVRILARTATQEVAPEAVVRHQSCSRQHWMEETLSHTTLMEACTDWPEAPAAP